MVPSSTLSDTEGVGGGGEVKCEVMYSKDCAGNNHEFVL